MYDDVTLYLVMAAIPPTRVVLQRIDHDPRGTQAEPDLQHLACQSGGFLGRKFDEPTPGVSDINTWAFETSFRLGQWRARFTWPPIPAKAGELRGTLYHATTPGGLQVNSGSWDYLAIPVAWQASGPPGGNP